MKYLYWHRVREVSKEYQKAHPEIKDGLYCSNKHKKDRECITVYDTLREKRYPDAYVLEYVCRLPANASTKEALNVLKAFEKEHPFKEENWAKMIEAVKKRSANCPADAKDHPGKKICGARKTPGGLFCTRDPGHKGRHHPHDYTNDSCYGSWTGKK